MSHTKLSDLCTIKVGMKDADFWLVRRSSIEHVGTPVREFNPEHIGIRVERTDILDAKYLFYFMQFLHMKGVFKQLAHGALRLVNIKASDIARMPVDLGQGD